MLRWLARFLAPLPDECAQCGRPGALLCTDCAQETLEADSLDTPQQEPADRALTDFAGV